MTCRESCAQRMLPLSAMRTGKVAMSPGEDGLIGIPFPEHSSEILSNLNAQRRAGLLCDLTLTSRGARYPTHRSVMAAVSLYFRRLFGAEEGDGGGEAGRGGGGFSVCQLDCVAPDALDALLEFAYTATLTIRSSGMRDVLRGAQLLGIQCVADACREILGETGEAEGEAWGGDNRAFPSEREKERGIERGSRRKKDRRKMERVQQTQRHPSSPLTSPPTVPVSPSPHPSPAHDPVRSLPPTLPPSPEPEYPSPKAGQNGERKWGREPEMGSKVNGGMHWPGERLFTTNPPSLPDERLSEEEEGLGNGGAVGASSTPAGGAVLGAAGGRKRKSQTPQQCPVCQKIIHGAGKLPRHMRTHTGEKPFQCSACGVRFTRNDKLKIHMRKHTGERPYSCPHCPARFLHSYDLKNHLSLHSGARPFECPLCHKAFAREDHLQRHRKGHSCLEMRTRRPRRGAGHGEDGRGAGGGGRGHIPDQVDQCEPLALNTPRPSGYLSGGALVDGEGPGSEASQLLQEAERERSVALHALSLLGAHRFHPGLSWTGVDLRGVRAAMEGNEMEGSRSPAPGQEVWEEEEEDEMGEDDDDEEEEE